MRLCLALGRMRDTSIPFSFGTRRFHFAVLLRIFLKFLSYFHNEEAKIGFVQSRWQRLKVFDEWIALSHCKTGKGNPAEVKWLFFETKRRRTTFWLFQLSKRLAAFDLGQTDSIQSSTNCSYFQKQQKQVTHLHTHDFRWPCTWMNTAFVDHLLICEWKRPPSNHLGRTKTTERWSVMTFNKHITGKDWNSVQSGAKFMGRRITEHTLFRRTHFCEFFSARLLSRKGNCHFLLPLTLLNLRPSLSRKKVDNFWRSSASTAAIFCFSSTPTGRSKQNV